jgi:hypothetical protein
MKLLLFPVSVATKAEQWIGGSRQLAFAFCLPGLVILSQVITPELWQPLGSMKMFSVLWPLASEHFYFVLDLKLGREIVSLSSY